MANGYIRLWRPGHRLAGNDGYVLEHRMVLHEEGAELPDGHHVHHRNGDRTDNRIENLVVVTPAEHGRFHRTARTERPCVRCGAMFYPWKAAGRFCSRVCANRRAVAE